MKPKKLLFIMASIFVAMTFILVSSCQKDQVEKSTAASLIKSSASVNNEDGPPGNYKPVARGIDVSSVTATTAVAGGMVTLIKGSPPVTEKGLVWDTFYFPTIEKNLGILLFGPGTGTFTGTLTGLMPGKVYYFCSFGTNANGTEYSSWEIFAPSDKPAAVECGGLLTDSRDGQTYQTIQIGDQCWMAENLNYGEQIMAGTSPGDDGQVEKFCYNNQTANCDIYGGLYDWDEVMEYESQSLDNPSGVQGICPEGWHVPSMAEVTQLEIFLGGQDVAGGVMKETGYRHWKKPNTGATNLSGFTALGNGWMTNGTYSNQLLTGYFWTTNQFWYPKYSIWYSWTFEMRNTSLYLSHYHYDRDFGIPVRCVKDAASY